MTVNTAINASAFPVQSNVVGTTDFVLVVANAASNNWKVRLVSANALLATTNGTVVASKLVITNNSSTPANSTISVTKGEMWTDGSYLYVAVSNSSIKRVTLSAF